MTKNESQDTGDSGKQRSQVRSSLPAGKRPDTAAESKRGDTVGRSGRGPTELPAQFGRYRVIKKLGGGGMGTVYLVENTELEREEALKVPHFSDGDDAHARERFLREAKSAAKLDHANLCPVWDAGVLDGVYYLTMRFLKGKLLSDYTGKAQPARKAVEIATKLAQALEAAHDKGVIHRDLKPANVMMVSGVGPVIMDFGLAKEVQKPDQKLTQAGSMLGTPAYMPPEQVNGELERMGPASDVYSLGVILYELLTGRLPFEGTMAMIFGQILYTEPPLPSDLVPGLNPTLDGICRKAMAKESAERYPSMDAFAAALLDYLRATPATEGTGNLVLTAEGKAAGLQAPTRSSSPPPGGKSAISKTPKATPEPLAAAVPPPLPVEATSIARKRSRRPRRSRPAPKPSLNLWLGIGAGVGVVLLGIIGLVAGILLQVKTPEGTLVVEGATIGDARPEGTLVVEGATIGDARIVGKWKSIDAPVTIIQEFTKGGQSKITFSGITTTGTYTLNGDIIDWKSSTMAAKVKVKFRSSTEMELSNDAGQTVKYKKIGTP